LPKLVLSLLGPPRVQYNNADVALERNKGLALLAYLAVSGESHRRDELAVLLWPELDEAHAHGGLRRALWELKGHLPGQWWDIQREAVGLLAGPGLALDVARFRQLLAVARAHKHATGSPCTDCCATLAKAVGLYRGDFLAGFSLRDCATYDEWQFGETEGLCRALAAALEQLAQAQAALGQFETAIAYALRWLVLDPLHESAHQHLMRLYAWSGQRPAALRQYDACVQVLETELGLAPHEQTVQLFQAIRDGRLAPPDMGVVRSDLAVIRPLTAPAVIQSPQRALDESAQPKHLAVLDRIGRGQFVGRELEWAQVSGAWQRATAGEGQVLLVSGEPGIGKTRLVSELVQAALRSRSGVLNGQCVTRGELPYAPFAHMAHEILGRLDDSHKLPDEVRAGLLNLAPRRSVSQARPASPSLPDPNIERLRLFDSFTNACRLLAEAAPLLLVIEDGHWADAGTLALLQHLARHIGESSILLLMTFRDSEVDLSETHGLADLLHELNRERQAQFIRLDRLDRRQSGRLLAALLDTSDVTETFRNRLFDETDGNPFYLEEVLKVLIEEGRLHFSDGVWKREDMRSVVLPPTVRAAILARMQRLPAATQEVLRVAAVLGQVFEFDLLKAASGQDQVLLRAALDRAMRAQLITASQAEMAAPVQYRFAHSLIPFTVRETLGGLRLQRLHRRAGRALEHVRPGDVEGLAFHYAAAGDQAKALDYACQAATRAENQYDYDTAVQHLQAALRLTTAGPARLALLEQLGDVLHLSDALADAVLAYQAALDITLSDLQDDRLTRVRLLRKLAEAVWITEYSMPVRPFEPAADAALAEGLRLMANQPPHPDTVRLLIARSHSAWRGRIPQDWAAAERDTHRAIALAEQLDAPLELSAVLESLATVFAARDLFPERAEIALRRVSLTRQPRFAFTRERSRALKEAGAALVDVGEYGQALGYLEESEKLASRMHAADDLIEGLSQQARCLFHLDRWDEVFMADKVRDLLERHKPHPLEPTCFHQALMASVHALRGEHEPAAKLRDESVAYMVRHDAPEAWGRGHHY
jgi:DNA-binding SARP family transcriptional activator